MKKILDLLATYTMAHPNHVATSKRLLHWAAYSGALAFFAVSHFLKNVVLGYGSAIVIWLFLLSHPSHLFDIGLTAAQVSQLSAFQALLLLMSQDSLYAIVFTFSALITAIEVYRWIGRSVSAEALAARFQFKAQSANTKAGCAHNHVSCGCKTKDESLTEKHGILPHDPANPTTPE